MADPVGSVLPSRTSAPQLQRTDNIRPHPNGTHSGTSTPTSPVSPSSSLPGTPQNGSTLANLRSHGRKLTRNRDDGRPTSNSGADDGGGVTVVHPGDPTRILMDIQKIQFIGSMIGNAAQASSQMTTKATGEAVDAVDKLQS